MPSYLLTFTIAFTTNVLFYTLSSYNSNSNLLHLGLLTLKVNQL